MPVFKRQQNDYQLDFSNRLSERLRKLDAQTLLSLSHYLRDKFHWLTTITADFPVLKIGFVTQEKAEQADLQIHTAISEWFRQYAKTENPPEDKRKENTVSKWLLITAVNNDIYADEFLTYEEALAKMKQEYDKTVEDWDDAHFTGDYASIQTECDQFDWKIFRVDFERG